MSADDDEHPLERAAHEAQRHAREALEQLDDLFERVVPTVRLPRWPDVPDVLDPWDMMPRLRKGTEWVEDQISPAFGPVADRIDDLRRLPVPAGDRGQPDEDDGWGPVAWVLFIGFLLWLAEQELALSVDIDRALWSFDETESDAEHGRFDLWNKTVFVPGPPLAARLGDPMMHGDPIAPGSGSADVLIGGKPALRQCDGHVCTKATPLPHASAGFTSTYGGVEINGFAALRVGDFVNEGVNGLNPIVAGCPTVTIGPVAPPVECWAPTGPEPARRPDPIPFRWNKGQLGHFKGTVALGVDIEGPFARVEGRVTAARLWAEHERSFDVPLGDVDGDGKDEAKRYTLTRKSERVLGVSDVKVVGRLRPPRGVAITTTVTPVPSSEIEVSQPQVTLDDEIVELP
ncbi:MAG: PAAR domain-containing protein [Nannocystaceae bacterium]